MAFCAYNEYQRRLLEDELGDESLFLCLHEQLNGKVMDDPDSINYDYGFVEVWEDAKLLVETIAKEKHPTLRAKEHIKSLFYKYETFSHKLRGCRDQPTFNDYYTLTPDEKQAIEQCVLICAYYMIRQSVFFYTVPKSNVLNKVLNWIKDEITYSLDLENTKDALLTEQVKGSLTYDYNYWEGKAIPKKKEDTKCEPESIEGERLMQLKEKNAELEKKLQEAEERNNELEKKIDSIKAEPHVLEEQNQTKKSNQKKEAAIKDTSEIIELTQLLRFELF